MSFLAAGTKAGIPGGAPLGGREPQAGVGVPAEPGPPQPGDTAWQQAGTWAKPGLSQFVLFSVRTPGERADETGPARGAHKCLHVRVQAAGPDPRRAARSG